MRNLIAEKRNNQNLNITVPKHLRGHWEVALTQNLLLTHPVLLNVNGA